MSEMYASEREEIESLREALRRLGGILRNSTEGPEARERIRSETIAQCIAAVMAVSWPPDGTERVTAWNEALQAAVNGIVALRESKP